MLEKPLADTTKKYLGLPAPVEGFTHRSPSKAAPRLNIPDSLIVSSELTFL